MAVIIVTDKCYISADRIKHVTVEEHQNRVTLKKTDCFYKIEIHYTSVDLKTQVEDEQRAEITMFNKKVCDRIFREIVTQIRDQNPDKDLIDKLIEEHLLA
jgi:hypothetical protein